MSGRTEACAECGLLLRIGGFWPAKTAISRRAAQNLWAVSPCAAIRGNAGPTQKAVDYAPVPRIAKSNRPGFISDSKELHAAAACLVETWFYDPSRRQRGAFRKQLFQ
jgi:hypothetical protein